MSNLQIEERIALGNSTATPKVICIDQGRYFNVSELIYEELAKRLNAVQVSVRNGNSGSDTADQLRKGLEHFVSSLIERGVDEQFPDQPSPRLLWGRKMLFNRRQLMSIVVSTQWVFSPAVVFVAVLFICFSLGLLAHELRSGVPPFFTSPADVAISVTLLLLATGIHEVGHLSAAHRVGAAFRGLGIGMYAFLPIAYSDVTGVWQVSRIRRIIVNISGAYFEILYVCTVFMVSYVLQWGNGWWLGSALALKALLALNPFVRGDGYWVVSDAFNVPNLSQASVSAFRQIVSKTILRSESTSRKISRKDYWLAFYSVSNSLFIGVIMAVVLRMFGESILLWSNALWALINGDQSMQVGAEQLFNPTAVSAILLLLVLSGTLTIKVYRLFSSRAGQSA